MNMGWFILENIPLILKTLSLCVLLQYVGSCLWNLEFVSFSHLAEYIHHVYFLKNCG